MTTGKNFIEKVKEYYGFLEQELAFKIVDEQINGSLFFDVQYLNNQIRVSVNYENLADFFQVIIYKSEGKLSTSDENAINLSDLNSKLYVNIDKNLINENNIQFEKFHPQNNIEKKLLKSAKELRLTLLHNDKLEIT